jgi:hypothetical protein
LSINYNLLQIRMKTNIKLIRWLPRIISILAILFVSMFALDSFDTKLTIWQQITAFLIHLTPSYILIACLILAWKWEKVGGIIYIIIGTIFAILIAIMNYNRTHSIMITLSIVLMLALPFILSGILFIYSHWLNKKQQNNKPKTEL